MNKKVGIVSTARITHATPAAVYARSADRHYEAGVPEGCTEQVDTAQQVTQRCDLLLGLDLLQAWKFSYKISSLSLVLAPSMLTVFFNSLPVYNPA